MGRFGTPLLALAFLIGVPAFASDIPGRIAGRGGPPERPAGPNLPFAISLPDGFRITIVSGIDAATYVIKRDDEPYLFVINQQFPAFDFKIDKRGRVSPRVQQSLSCGAFEGAPQIPPHRQILHLSRETSPEEVKRKLTYLDHDFIIVWEAIDMPAAKQAVADQIASTISVPGMTQPIQRSALMICP